MSDKPPQSNDQVSNQEAPKKKTLEDLLKLLALQPEDDEPKPKPMKDYKFWKTQPVPTFDEKFSSEGPIDKPKKT